MALYAIELKTFLPGTYLGTDGGLCHDRGKARKFSTMGDAAQFAETTLAGWANTLRRPEVVRIGEGTQWEGD